MKALILDSNVVDVSNEEFEVAPEMIWVDCSNDVVAGWSYKDGVFSPPPAPTNDEKLLRCKQKAAVKIATVDWAVLPDVNLQNKTEFETYRAALRALILNPVADPVFPTEPTPVWS